MPLPTLAGPGRSPLRLLAVVFVCGGLFTVLRGDTPAAEDACVGVDGLPCEYTPGVDARLAGDPAPAEAPVLSRSESCRDGAYLCAGLAERGPLRVMRWDEATPEVRVLVPMPPHEDPAVGRQLQQSAARGIRAWDGHPFPIRIDLRERAGATHDVTVRWALRLGTTELGVASTEWVRAGGRATMVVRDFALSTRNPFDGNSLLPARQVELTAAHEMGHALGLPHSDAPYDVMYPTNTASAPSARDYRAMETLYRLANGAELK